MTNASVTAGDINGKLLIAVYDRATGIIRQQSLCSRKEAELQHLAWPNCDFVPLSSRVDPCKWRIDVKTKEVVERQDISDGERSLKEQELHKALQEAMQVTHEHQTDMMHAAAGDAEAQKRVKAHALKRQDYAQQHFRLVNALKFAKTKKELEAIKWQN